MKKAKLYLLICILSMTILGGCNKQVDSNAVNNIEISNNESSANKQFKYDNSITKRFGNKYYLADNSVIDISNFSSLNSETNIAIDDNSRLFTMKYGNKDMYYIYSAPDHKNFVVNNMKGTEVTGVISNYSANSIQILDDNVYNVSLNCAVSYSNSNEYKLYSEIANTLKKDVLVKILIVNNEVVKIFLL